MINFLKNILNFEKLEKRSIKNIQKISRDTKIEKVFSSIEKFSEKSEVRYVGGCIRKILSFERVDDIDLAANITPKEIIEVLKKNKINYYETGIDHGTITANIDGQNFEITSLRKDISTDGRHAKVEYSNNWFVDASRRDFTINSIYADIEGNLYDPFNGKEDLINGKVKFIGDPDKRIKEDYLRILRYIRFFLNYSKLEHEDEVKKIIKKNISGIAKISSDRLLNELTKLISSKQFLKLFSDNFSLEIVELIFPQLKNMHLFKKLNNYAYENFKQNDFIFILSLMIIDDSDNCEYFLYKFNLSNNQKKRIRFLKEFYSNFTDKNFYSEKNLSRIFYIHGRSLLIDLLNFMIFLSKNNDKKLINLKEFFNNQPLPIFPIKAKELMNKYNLKEGIELGKKLKEIENIWIDNHFKITEKEIDKVVND